MPVKFRADDGSPPPSRTVGSPPPGMGSVHAGAFSTALRCGEAYSARTLLQSQLSSSATIMGHEVRTPVPISVCATRIVTVSSGAIVSQALISGTIASRYQGCPATGSACAGGDGRWKRSTRAPPAAVAEARKSRRLMSVFGVVSMVAVIFAVMAMLPRSRFELGRPVDRLADARIGPTAADIGDLGIDVGVGRLRVALEQS